MTYPELDGKQWVAVEVKLSGWNNWRSGMFYYNGGKPVFACFGNNVTERVIEWRYGK